MRRDALIVEPDFVDRYPERADSRAWLVSLLLHLTLLVVFGLITTAVAPPVTQILISSDLLEEPLEIPEIPPEKFQVQIDSPDVGASSLADAEAARSLAPEIGDATDVPTPDVEPFDFSQFRFLQPAEPIQGYELSDNQIVKGSAGFAVTGAEGAVDRITQEILASLEERKTLVVWFFDQSASLIRQRETIRKRFDRIYEELGVIEKSGSSRFTRHGPNDALLTSVVAFGKDVSFPTKKPTADYEEIRAAVQNIERDNSGDEFVFTAIQKSITRYKKYRRTNNSGEPERNVMFVVFSDEAGDDQELLDTTTRQCTNLAIPVYVVGVPAPFGRKETTVKWVDPDPEYDQTPGRGVVSQGPESLLPERVQIAFSKYQNVNMRLDSGFGPFALTRLARESGGHYFPVHANREANGKIRWKDVPAYSSHLSAFFDPKVMRHYRPDYVSAAEYERRVRASKARLALVEAARQSAIVPMDRPRTRFVKRDEASLANALTEAQKAAASLEPTINKLLSVLKEGERERKSEAVPRWQAGYDLAMGRVLAVKARTEGYNLMLAEAKRGKKFADDKNNTWTLTPATEVSVGSQISNTAEKAEEYLTRVISDHDGTPWAYLAQAELKEPFGWKWVESRTNLNPRPNAIASNNQNNQPSPEDERRRMLQRGPERRPVPKL